MIVNYSFDSTVFSSVRSVNKYIYFLKVFKKNFYFFKIIRIKLNL